MTDDYEPLKQPNFLEKIMILIMMIVSAVFWRKRRRTSFCECKISYPSFESTEYDCCGKCEKKYPPRE